MFESASLRVRRAIGLSAGAVLLLAAGCSGAAGPTCGSGAGAGSCTRVLFLGNSFTYVNDLPSTFAQLAQSGGRPVQVDMVANGGETLAQHAASSDDLGKIASQSWTYVVLQEQSDTPATSGGRSYMYPAAQTLAGRAEAVGAVPLLFMTWAHQNGEPDAGEPTYESMQQQVDASYIEVAQKFCACRWLPWATRGTRSATTTPRSSCGRTTAFIRPRRERTWPRASSTLRSSGRARLV